jgi:hypothetical protein
MIVNESSAPRFGQLAPTAQGLARVDPMITSSIEILRQADGTVSFLCTRSGLPVFETFLTAEQASHLLHVLNKAIGSANIQTGKKS